MPVYNIKRLIAFLIAVMFGHDLFSQVTIIQPPGVEIYIIKKEAVTDASSIAGLTNAEKLRNINYADGFGRPVQSITAAGSPNGKDIVGFSKYDQYGRKPKQYLPFEAVTSTGVYNDMSTVATDQVSFYNPANAPAKKIAIDNGPYYAESSFESSPLGRVLTTGGVGDGFQLNQHYKTLNYRNNTGSGTGGDNVLQWVLGGSATSTSSYAANELSVTEVVDENGNTSKVFKDRFGRLILKRQPGNLDTYYVYDNIGNIVYIVPPKAIAKMGVASNYTTAYTPDLIYQFWYDSKNRIIRKKVPGATEVYMVYDPLDRVVLTQDGNMRNSSPKKWAYVKYDNANRVIIQGIYTNNNSLTQMQIDVNNENCYSSTSTTYYEIRQASTSGYSNQCFPTSTSNTEERGYNYYDNYDFDYDGTEDYSKQDQGLTDEATATNLTYGLATGSKTKILGSGNPGTWLVTVSFYDKYYHVIQVRSNNQIRTTVTDHTTNVVNFAGQAVQAKQVKTINDPYGITGTLEITVSTRYEYDDMGRLLKVKQTNPGAAELIVAKYEYNALGQLVDKKLHSTNNGVNYLQSVDMRYNLRGQLLSINNSTRNVNANNNDEANDVFGMEILYDKEETGSTEINNTGNFTGMISAVKWSAGQTGSPVNNALRSFKYSYDNLNRLTGATYQEKGSTAWDQRPGDFDESFTYDQNGNILTTNRWAKLAGITARTKIDELTYTYKNSDLSNQLDYITDNISANTAGYGYRNFAGAAPNTSYGYDNGNPGNGNLTNDPQKGTTITYNELNKPTVVQISSTKKVEYRYDAAGTRISKYVYNNNSMATKRIEYIGGYVIENDVLSYYSMAEGRVRNEGGGYGLSMKMEYFITDHQGNTRVSFEDDGTNTNHAVITQENSYYAFGMQMAGSTMPTNANKKLYNAGSEWQDDIDGLADYYSTFYREYDPVIGRFNGVDPMSESFESWTTYHYSYNNPVNFNDPMGDYPYGGLSATPMRDRIDALDMLLTGKSFFGDEGSAGGGGYGRYYRGFGNGDNYFGHNGTAYSAFWKSVLDLAQEGKKVKRDKNGVWGYWADGDYINGKPGKGITLPEVVFHKKWVTLTSNGIPFGGGGIGIMQNGNRLNPVSDPSQHLKAEFTARMFAGSYGADFWHTGIRGGYREVTVVGWKDNQFEVGGNIIKNGKFDDKIKRTTFEVGVNFVGYQYQKDEVTHLDGSSEEIETMGYNVSFLQLESSKNLKNGKSFDQVSININAAVGILIGFEVGIKIPVWREYH